ncbi:hypothetical protein [Streptomyces alboflavus]|uniref:hypothetical protein n=1 Tax=Streptomyces alboflavus TaxID=67267 RepID=UPI000F658422|nr:hypothetical protein [Streptomyces alboflavus]
MKRTPRSTSPATISLVKPAPTRMARLRRWVRCCRSDAALYLLRGICYGLGTGLVGFSSYWLQQHL